MKEVIDNLPNPELIQMREDLTWLRMTLEGKNGKRGFFEETDSRLATLTKMIEENTNFRIGLQANMKLIAFAAGSGWILAVLIVVLQVIDVI